MKDISDTEVCPRDDVAAYVDGELSQQETAAFERHVKGCTGCSSSLRQQRQFLAALSASLESDPAIDLPGDFTRKVVTYAESSVCGVRRPNELFTAACISAALFLFLLFSFGGEAVAIASAAGSIGEKILTVGSFALKMIGSAVFSVAVVSRSLASYFDARALIIVASSVVIGTAAFLSSRRIVGRGRA